MDSARYINSYTDFAFKKFFGTEILQHDEDGHE